MRPYRYSKFAHVRLCVRRYRRWYLEWTIIAKSIRRRVRGIEVAVAVFRSPQGFPIDKAFAQVEDALMALARYTPFIEQGIRRRKVNIVLDDVPWPAHWPMSNIICLPAGIVIDGDAVPTASMIVHEWTHARVAQATSHAPHGFDERLAKEEALCTREQREFVEGVPDADYPYKTATLRTIDEGVANEYWKPAALNALRAAWKPRRYAPE